MDFKEYLDKDAIAETDKMYKKGMDAKTLFQEIKDAGISKEKVVVKIAGKKYLLKLVTMHDDGSISLVAE